MNNSLVKWERYSPVSMGLEQMFHRLDSLADAGTNFPPYNILKVSENETVLEVALAGYTREQLEVVVERQVLTISATKKEDETELGEYTHRAVASRSFAKNFQLGDAATVQDVKYQDGLLTLRVVVEIPEEQQRKSLPIS